MSHDAGTRSLSSRVAALALGLAAVGAFCVIIEPAGHGIGVAGLLLYWGLFDSVGGGWHLVTLPVYAAVAIFLASTPVGSRKFHTRVFALGLAGLAFGWINLLGMSDLKSITFATSVPFLATAAWAAFFLRGKVSPAPRGAGPRGFEVVQPPGAPRKLVRPPPPAVPSPRDYRHPQ
jgi:hypothetical protein